ncbi:MAG: SCO6880 family protein [Acidimicrobiales bacterium]
MTTSRTEPEGARYRFGPLEQRGLVAGWRGGQLAAVGAVLVLDVLVVRAMPSAPGVVLATLLLAAALAAVLWPVSGRTVEEWAPDVVRHLADQQRRRRRATRRDGLFGALQLLSVDGDDAGGMCVVHDRAAGTYSALIRAGAPGFLLADAEEQSARVAGWSTVMAGLARRGSAVHRVQWLARCLPDDGTALYRYAERAVVGDDHPARRQYLQLLEAQAEGARLHEVLIVLTVDARRAARAVRGAGGGDRGACTVVMRELQALRRALGDAGIESSAPLDHRSYVTSVRQAFERDAVSPTLPARRATWPWPMNIEPTWSAAHADGTWHATYWVGEWPRLDVGPEFLGPMLVGEVRRTVSVVMEPVDSVRAARRIEQQRTADVADAELRRRGGFLATARRRREEETLERREHELADGHAQYRFAAYVTVTAADEASLDDGCARTEQAAGRAGLELRRCYGDQGAAFTCTLPLGRGLH